MRKGRILGKIYEWHLEWKRMNAGKKELLNQWHKEWGIKEAREIVAENKRGENLKNEEYEAEKFRKEKTDKRIRRKR